MAEEPLETSFEGRPVSRRSKAKARAENLEEQSGMNEAGPSAEQQAKEKKKPRKLERRNVVLQEPTKTLDTRVETLERQFASLSSRVDAVEVRQVRRPTAATYRRSSSTSTRATSAGRARPRGSTPRSTPVRPTLADQLRESQRLRKSHQRRKSGENDSIEEIPRSALTTPQSRQVALTGQYNIPLPTNLSPEDILNIKSGLTAAGSIARSLANAWTTPTQTQEAGTSGTTTPRGSGAGASRSVVHARSGGAKAQHDSAGDRQEQAARGDDDKENVFDAAVSGGNVSSSGGGVGNAQPEGTPKVSSLFVIPKPYLAPQKGPS